MPGTTARTQACRYPLNVRHPAPLNALRAEIARQRAAGAERIGLMGFSAGGHLGGLATLAPGAAPASPPFFVWHTAEDAYVPPEHTYRFASALAASGVPPAVHPFRQGSRRLRFLTPSRPGLP
jgi:acetyl esterase/lipase